MASSAELERWKEGAAMRLTWKDAVTTLFVAAIVAIYVTFLNGTSLWLISSTRGTTAAVLVLDFVGGCALSAPGGVRATAQPRWARVLSAIASTWASSRSPPR
jgi:hypothetical protein